MSAPTYIASIADIKYFKDVPEEFLPYLNFQAGREGRSLKEEDRIAFLNINTTTSYIVVFLDKGKTIDDVKREVGESGASINADSSKVLDDLLKENI